MANYKPYSIEWSRKRYLSEAIQSYFESEIEPEKIYEDIHDILEEWSNDYMNKSNKIKKLNSLFK